MVRASLSFSCGSNCTKRQRPVSFVMVIDCMCMIELKLKEVILYRAVSCLLLRSAGVDDDAERQVDADAFGYRFVARLVVPRSESNSTLP
jgi:hypothetical protein